MLEWFLVNEQFGRMTNGLHWHVPNVYNVWADATDAQVERYVPQALAGHGGDAYAVTEAEAGSDPAESRRRRRRTVRAAAGSTARSGSSPPATSRACSS